jgi:hypothetical protein
MAPTMRRAARLLSTFALAAASSAWTVGQSSCPVDAFSVSSGVPASSQARRAAS